MQGAYTMEHYSAIKGNEILLFAAILVNFEGTMLSGISHREGWYYTISFIREI